MSGITLRLLGTGTSQGIPVIGCRCEVCLSADPRDRRLRTSGMITIGDVTLVIDVGPDFRQQILRAGLHDIHAVLLTHEHNDHVSGLDDLRPVNFLHRRSIPLYGSERTLGEVRRRFAYAFDEEYDYPGKPRVTTSPVTDDPFRVKGLEVLPLPADHGGTPVLGYRVGPVAYLTDVKTVPPSTLERMLGLEILVLNALRWTPHPTHLNIAEAHALADRLSPRRCVLTHISHDMGPHARVDGQLPSGLELGYDEMILSA